MMYFLIIVAAIAVYVIMTRNKFNELQQMIKNGVSDIGVQSLGVNALKPAQFAGQGAYDVLGRIHHNAYNVNLFLFIGKPQPPNDVLTVLVEQIVDAFHRILIFHYYADHRDSCLHMIPPDTEKRIRQKGVS